MRTQLKTLSDISVKKPYFHTFYFPPPTLVFSISLRSLSSKIAETLHQQFHFSLFLRNSILVYS